MAGTEEQAGGPAAGSTKSSDVLRAAVLRLKWAGIEEPVLDAEVLLSFCIRQPRPQLLVHPRRPLTAQEFECFEILIGRRCRGEPVAYLIGEKEFWSLPLKVDSRVLIPRPDTEVLVEEALKIFPPEGKLSIMEIGTGSGAISIALARELPRAEITATDISPGALEIARLNARANGVANRIGFAAGDLFEPVAGRKFDLIISNPPYISEAEFGGLSRDIRDFEPLIALVPGPAGTECHERIIRAGKGFLRPGGALILEIGARQGKKIEEILRKEGYKRVAFRKDYAGHVRVAVARSS